MTLTLRNLAFWLSCIWFVPTKVNIPEYGINIIGYFPYHRARLNPSEVFMGRYATPLQLPRELFRHIERILEQKGIADNKAVYICESTDTTFNNMPFALMFKDTYCMVGEWDNVVNWEGKPINQK